MFNKVPCQHDILVIFTKVFPALLTYLTTVIPLFFPKYQCYWWFYVFSTAICFSIFFIKSL